VRRRRVDFDLHTRAIDVHADRIDPPAARSLVGPAPPTGQEVPFMVFPYARFSAAPDPVGLYDGRHEHDACGVAFVATMRGVEGHDIVQAALTALRNLNHRGAVGAEEDTGDGAGILTQVPDAFLRAVVRESSGVELPPAGQYAVGMAFLPDDDEAAAAQQRLVERIAGEEGLRVLCWRDVPTTAGLVGATARACQPRFRQVFVTSAGEPLVGLRLERAAFCLRRRAELETEGYFSSPPARTLVYTGMRTTR